ncbi:probable multidrug resistance-associated protein lethal(2)03659 [Diorhabda sublineata]|uniref:probable multidrug resistance-associated protein lethal(2)03659 n=1 Tax=Diorhabda sublineata TaxID=1163346 RepID=UPI0024E063AC|nr:probable multidrug resistance-associated protein lethal(2)03659 [Diorhabda sublineata]
MDGATKKTRKPNPRENAFPLSAATFSYIIPTFIEGYKRDLEESDLTETLSEHRSDYLGNTLENYWKQEEQRAKKNETQPSLQKVLLKTFGWEYLFLGIILVIAEAVKLAQPIVLGRLVRYFDIQYQKTSITSSLNDNLNVTLFNTTDNLLRSRRNVDPDSQYSFLQIEITHEEAYYYAAGVVLCSLISILLSHPYMFAVCHMGMKIRVACCSLIYRKALRLSKTALGDTTAGQIVNLLSNDVNRFDYVVIFAHQMWLAPLETVVCTYFMYQEVGVAAVIGVLVVIAFVPLQAYLGRMISVLRMKTALRTDERVRLMNEILSGIQVIKMYAWEKPFASMVAKARRYEIKSIRSNSFLRGIFLSFIMYNTRMALFVCILAYVLDGNSITAEKVFVLTTYYNVLRQSMTVFFPQGIAQIAEGRMSVKRLNKFMLFEEIDLVKNRMPNLLDTSGSLMSAPLNGIEKPEKEELGISLTNVSAKWSEMSVDNTLTNINLKIKPGQLLGVIGPVGSGKSSLLHVILQELPLVEGNLKINGVISYASQEPWLFAGSVRQNILFGQPMDKLRYKTVIKKCALERDFTLLPYGDKTIVGDRGVSLSGGQRARINLARAVYKQADIYLLDDPLSAVDTHVGKELFEQCIIGYLKNKTVILVTHQIQYLQDIDSILYLDDGVPTTGSFRELQASGLDFTKSLGDSVKEKEAPPEAELSRQLSVRSTVSVEQEAPKQVEEQKSTGSIGGYVYKSYFKAGGNCCVIFFIFFFFIASQLFASISDYYLSYWVNIEQEEKTAKLTGASNNTSITSFWHFSRETSIYIYTILIVLLIVVTMIRSFTFFIVCMRASTRLHDNMFINISRATMRFFNTNSAGRILNRFSKDMGSIDELLPAAMIDCLQIGLSLLGIIVVVAVVTPWLMLPTFIIGVVFYFVRIFYLRTSRNVKRLEGVTRSPVFSHLNASISGLTTIRAFNAEDILTVEFDNHQDLHSSAWFTFIATSRAFGYWLDILCVVYITLVTFSFLLIGNSSFGGNVGLAITQAIGLTGMFQWGMRQSTELENQMTAVERVLEYNDIEKEGELESKPDKKPRSSWPENGKVEFKDVYLRYFPDDPFVLKGLKFVVQSKEKIGIVGRTGAGKSSLINALFQLTETVGEILIDDVNISEIGLHDLRRKISIIPQEPVLFSGTMRKNLDPFDEFSDADLWKVLEEVELKEAVENLVSGLTSKMSEGGSNFSVGQRQLVCLARAILRNNKILVLDEATANVDPQTDALIQQTIRTKFADCTVLTIAHRLNTIMDSDKVLVMDAGTLKEFDHPYLLIQNHNSIFYSMVQQTGKSMVETLFNVARESYYERFDKNA